MTSLSVVLFSYVAVAAIAVAAGPKLGRRVFALVAVAPAATLVWAGKFTPFRLGLSIGSRR